MALQQNFFTKRLRKALRILSFIFLVAIVTSCIPQKHIVLMQDDNDDGQRVFPALEHITDRYIIQPNDYLYINVSSPDPNLSVYFNPSSQGCSNSNTPTQRN